jgi:eukaryotic-like serine/threonine-protein kinase
MAMLFVCEKGHARLPDAWERTSSLASLDPCIACGATVTLQEIGPEIDRKSVKAPPGYEIICPLSGAAMSDVYKALHLTSKSLVALKISRSDRDAEPGDRARIRREAQTLSELSHPHIVRWLDTGNEKGRTYFSMEWLRGGDLSLWLCDSQLRPRMALELVVKLSDAIHYAHRNRIVHRDMRPRNIVFSDRGEPKLVDFGLAKRLHRPGGRTRNGAMTGDPRYMAPEQASGNAQVIGPAVDIHALGVILYQTLTGRLPFEGTCFHERLRLACLPMPPTTLEPSLPNALDDICLRCLRREPEQRYATASELADDLRRVVCQAPGRRNDQ